MSVEKSTRLWEETRKATHIDDVDIIVVVDLVESEDLKRLEEIVCQ